MVCPEARGDYRAWTERGDGVSWWVDHVEYAAVAPHTVTLAGGATRWIELEVDLAAPGEVDGSI